MDVVVSSERREEYKQMPHKEVEDWRVEVAKRIDALEARVKALEDAARNPG